MALTFKRGSDFREKSRDTVSTWNFYIKNLLQDRAVAVKILIQILAASLVLQGLGLMLPVFTKIMVDHVLVMQTHDLLRILGLGLLVLVLMYLVIHYLRGALLVYLQGRIDSRMMTGFLRHVMSLPYRFFQQRRSGDLLMRLSSNITIREIITNQTLSMILDGFFVLGYLVIILIKAPILAAVVLLLGGIQAVILFGTKQKIHQLMQSNLVASAETQSYLIEILRGKRDSLITGWQGAVRDTYPKAGKIRFKQQSQEFNDPIGHILRRDMPVLVDLVLKGELDKPELQTHLEPLCRLRSVQEFTPAEAIGFVYSLKKVVRESLKEGELNEPGLLADHHLITCPLQPGHLRISDKACAKRHQMAQQSTDKRQPDSAFLFAIHMNLQRCRDCRVGRDKLEAVNS